MTPHFTTGTGQFHSNEATAKERKPYGTKTDADIFALALDPVSVPKPEAPWALLSGYPSRNFKEQEQNGSYNAIALDIDSNAPTFLELIEFVELVTGTANGVAYLTASATAENPKARVITMLKHPLPYSDFRLAAETFNDLADEHGIAPDRAVERAAQLIYLPNRGKHYDCYIWRDGEGFNPLVAWADRIEAKRAAIVAAEQELAERQKAVQDRRNDFRASGNASAVEAFNASHSVAEVLLKAGYEQRGRNFRHPHSESGSFSAGVLNNRVFALSPSDPLYTGEGAHDAFSAWATLFFGGDTTAAAKAVYAMIREAS